MIQIDPIANIAEQRKLANELMNGNDDFGDSVRLAELVLALDEWRNKGGFDPYTTSVDTDWIKEQGKLQSDHINKGE